MSFVFDERRSDSPLVETIWRTESGPAGTFTSVAVSRWEMVVTRQPGRLRFTVRGPETRATPSPIPGEAEFVGVVFKHGVFMPRLPGDALVDRALDLPGATHRCFWLQGSAFPCPTFDSIDTFVHRLVRAGVLTFDPLVDAVLRGEQRANRTVRRHVRRATGLTLGAIRQIDRARQAAALLQQGLSVIETVHETGYFDQPHLTRSLKRLIGHTPAELLRLGGDAEMSLSYKTEEFRQARATAAERRKR
jgi:AraC-like DNA-binding protein